MDKARVINFAQTVFAGMESINEDLYRGELKIKSNTPAGIFYLDFNKNITSQNFKSYQEQIIAEDYYRNPGSIQWNYYLLLFGNYDKITRKSIERDHKFARKYIFNEEEFESFFKNNFRSSARKLDVVNDIKSRLNEIDLQEIYSENPVQSAFERFKRDETIRNVDYVSSPVIDEIQELNYINEITLNPNFRKYPNSKTTFAFGKVNLITGINGVGKTSLLEGIELLAAGRTLRNENVKDPDGCVEGLINGNQIEKVQPSNVNKYRQRDQRWYSKSYLRQNETHSSFNTYNYFNSDATYNIATSMDEKEINGALKNLILGPEYHYITERIKDFYEYIRPEYNKLKNGLENSYRRKKELEDEISKIKLDRSIKELVSNAENLISKIGITVDYEDLTKDIAKVELSAKKLHNAVGRITSTFPDVISLEHHKIARSQFDSIKSAFDDFQVFYNSNVTQSQDLQNQINTLQSSNEFYKNCLKYLSHRNFSLIQELAINYEKNTLRINQLDNIKAALKEVGSFRHDSNLPIDQLNQSLQLNIYNIRKDIEQLNKSKQDIYEKIGSEEKELRRIFSLVRHLIANKPETEVCPVCESYVPQGHLVNKINRSIHFEYSKELESLDTSLRICQNLLDKCQSEIRSLVQLRTISNILGWPKDGSINGLLEEINELFAQDETLRVTYESHALIRNELSHEQDLSVDEFKFLQQKAVKNGFTLDVSNLLYITSKVEESTFELRTINHRLDNLMHDRDIRFQEMKLLLGLDDEIRFSINQLTHIINSQYNSLLEIDSYFTTIDESMKLTEKHSLKEIKSDLDNLKVALSIIRQETTQAQSLNQLLDSLNITNDSIERNFKSFNRFEKAYKTLNNLMENDGSSNLKDFFSQNLNEIIGVFRAIHQPREFKSITFDKKGLNLVTIEDKVRSLNQISTGQRSAVALAIFITLHRKLSKGPNIVLFDDPVSYIDDMNALSFIDYLRFFVLNEGKQIFFATANDKLSGLFERKFEYLGDDFCKISLYRAE